MSDDLDELEQEVTAYHLGNLPLIPGERVLALITRCRAAEADAQKWREYLARRTQMQRLLAGFEEVEE